MPISFNIKVPCLNRKINVDNFVKVLHENVDFMDRLYNM